MVRFSRALFGAACAAILAIAALAPAHADNKAQRKADYFLDFRSRPAYLFGHSFIVYGRIDEHGRAIEAHREGIYPTDGQTGLIMGSAILPVSASVRAVHGDYKEQASNSYRRRLTKAQYDHLMRVVRGLRASDREWNLLFKNCNDFSIEVAKAMGLTTPGSWLPPYYFVDALRLLNGD